MTDEPDKEKKIFVDEDWKSQVEAEKQTFQQQQKDQPSAESKQAEATGDDPPWPAPTLILLATTMATQAMVAMGLVANPVTGKSEPQLNQAKHFIDTLQMLQDKTEGNRTPDETASLENMLHELRMGYLAVRQQQDTAE